MIENHLKHLILEKYKSVKDCAAAIGIPYTTLDSILKRGVNKANIINIIKLCKALHIDTDSLAEGKIIPRSKQVCADVTREEYKIIQKYRALDAHGKEMLEIIADKEFARIDEDERLRQKHDLRDIPRYLDSEEEIEAEVESYRRQLLEEKEVAENQQALRDIKGA